MVKSAGMFRCLEQVEADLSHLIHERAEDAEVTGSGRVDLEHLLVGLRGELPIKASLGQHAAFVLSRIVENFESAEGIKRLTGFDGPVRPGRRPAEEQRVLGIVEENVLSGIECGHGSPVRITDQTGGAAAEIVVLVCGTATSGMDTQTTAGLAEIGERKRVVAFDMKHGGDHRLDGKMLAFELGDHDCPVGLVDELERFHHHRDAVVDLIGNRHDGALVGAVFRCRELESETLSFCGPRDVLRCVALGLPLVGLHTAADFHPDQAEGPGLRAEQRQP